MLRAAWVIIALTLAAPFARATDASRLDVESRIQYGYYTEDLHALQNLVDSLQGDTKTDALHGYYVGLASYRLALLYAERAPDRAKALLERCVSGLDESLKAQADFAESLALQAACLHRLGELTSLAVPLAGHRSGTEMRRALALAYCCSRPWRCTRAPRTRRAIARSPRCSRRSRRSRSNAPAPRSCRAGERPRRTPSSLAAILRKATPSLRAVRSSTRC
jgi:hypothetical protein